MTNNSLITFIMQPCFFTFTCYVVVFALLFTFKPSNSKHLNKMARLSIVTESIKSSKKTLRKIMVNQNSSFYESTRYILITAQAFAVMPLNGLCYKGMKGKLDQLTFRWGSINTIYSICCILSIGSMCIIAAKSSYEQGGLKIGKICETLSRLFFYNITSFNLLAPLIFYVVNLIILLQFFSLAKKWPALMFYWKSIEDSLPKSTKRPRIVHNIHFFAIFVLCFSFIEHTMSIMSNLVNVMQCPQQHSITEAFFRSHMGFIFNIIDYNLYLALFSKWMNIISTFTWSFMDLFIIMIALGLSNMFRRLNGFLLKQDMFDKGEAFWAEQRKSYRKVCDLIEKVDHTISTLTLISFSNNLFFICLQLLNSLMQVKSCVDIPICI